MKASSKEEFCIPNTCINLVHMETPILYSFLLYFLFITFPLIPAVLIYKIFPDSQVGATGVLGQLKINATGAFAAYLITSTMSFFVVQYAQGNITNSFHQTWTVASKIHFVDKEGKPLQIDANKMTKQTIITVQPDAFLVKNSNLVKFLVTGKGKDIIINFSYSDDFTSQTFDLNSLEPSQIDETNRFINLGTVNLQEIEKKYHAEKAVQAVQSGPPILSR